MSWMADASSRWRGIAEGIAIGVPLAADQRTRKRIFPAVAPARVQPMDVLRSERRGFPNGIWPV